MKRTLLRLCVALSTFALGAFASSAFERSMYVSPDLVAAPVVVEPSTAPAPRPLMCKVHGFEMWPERGSFESAVIVSQKIELATENSGGEYERRFPNCYVALKTGERDKYTEVFQIYSCPKCRAAYRAWERRWANSP
jgi:hypothetical protein